MIPPQKIDKMTHPTAGQSAADLSWPKLHKAGVPGGPWGPGMRRRNVRRNVEDMGDTMGYFMEI